MEGWLLPSVKRVWRRGGCERGREKRRYRCLTPGMVDVCIRGVMLVVIEVALLHGRKSANCSGRIFVRKGWSFS